MRIEIPGFGDIAGQGDPRAEAGLVDLCRDGGAFGPLAEDHEARGLRFDARESPHQRAEILRRDEPARSENERQAASAVCAGKHCGRAPDDGIVNAVHAIGGSAPGCHEIIAQRIRDRDRCRREARGERRQHIGEPAQHLRLGCKEAVIGKDGAPPPSAEHRCEEKLEIGDAERRQGGVGLFTREQAGKPQNARQMTAAEDLDANRRIEIGLVLVQLVIDGEDHPIAAPREAARQDRPCPLGAAAGQRVGVEQDRARLDHDGCNLLSGQSRGYSKPRLSLRQLLVFA